MGETLSEASKPASLSSTWRTQHAHDHVRLAQAPNGEIGPRCSMCNKRMTFGAAMVLNNNYVCWPATSKQPVPTPQRWSAKPLSASTPAEAWVQAVSSPPDVRWTAGRALRIVSAATTVALSFGNRPACQEGNGCSSHLAKVPTSASIVLEDGGRPLVSASTPNALLFLFNRILETAV